MKPVLDCCIVRRDGKPTKISILEALKNRREMMSCPECGGRVRPHAAHTPNSPQPHFEHFPPTPKDCRYSVRSKGDKKKRPWAAKASAIPCAEPVTTV